MAGTKTRSLMLLAATALLSASVAAADVLVVPGKGLARAPMKTLAGQLCAQVPCTRRGDLLRQGGAHWRALRGPTGVTHVLTSKVARRAGRWVLDLQLLTAGGDIVLARSVGLSKRGVNPLKLEELAGAVLPLLRPVPEPRPEPSAEHEREGEREREQVREVEPAPVLDTETEPAAEDSVSPRLAAEPAPAFDETSLGQEELPVAEPEVPWLTVSLGGQLLARSLSYEALESPGLVPYELRNTVVPSVALSVYPFEQLGATALRAFTLEASYARGFGVSSYRDGSPSRVSTQLSMLDVRMGYRLPALELLLPLTLTPTLRAHRFEFSLGSAGTSELPGVPGVAYESYGGGARLELRLLDEALSASVEGTVLAVLSSGELVSASYFSRGRSLAYELAGGVAVRVAPHWDVLASARLTRHVHRFQVEPGAAYVASGATDQVSSIGLSLRASL